MTKTALREFYDSPKAFRPFGLHLTSGKALVIEHRENLPFTNDPDTIIVTPKADEHPFSIISISEIAEVSDRSRSGPNGTKRRKGGL
ncbi:MAG: hypothetical protein FJ403_07300 [Verrucomicrobia bacterium]|nr:hypothetical protein [Verrucomicrobiota bacterium]